jgi:ClpP class serine protease
MKAKLTHKLANEPWAIRPEYHSTLVEAAHEDGGPYEPPTPEEVDGIAIIHIHGPLGKMLTDWELMFGMTDYDDIATQLAEADANPNVTAILLHIDSPGGTITGLPELAAKMRAVEKPLVAYIRAPRLAAWAFTLPCSTKANTCATRACALTPSPPARTSLIMPTLSH